MYALRDADFILIARMSLKQRRWRNVFQDHSGTLEGAELSNLAREMLSVTQKDGYYNAADVYELEKALLKGCDLNQDGRIDRRELALIIGAIANAQSPGMCEPLGNRARLVTMSGKSLLRCAAPMKIAFVGFWPSKKSFTNLRIIQSFDFRSPAFQFTRRWLQSSKRLMQR